MSKWPISICYKTSPPLSFWQVVSFCGNCATYRIEMGTYRSLCVPAVSSQFAKYLPSFCSSQGQKSANFNMTLKRNLFLFVYKSRQKNGKGWLLRTMCAVIICHQNSATLQNSKIVPALFDSKTSTANNAAPPKLFASNLKFRYFPSFFARFPDLLLSPQSEMIHTVEEYFPP